MAWPARRLSVRSKYQKSKCVHQCASLINFFFFFSFSPPFWFVYLVCALVCLVCRSSLSLYKPCLVSLSACPVCLSDLSTCFVCLSVYLSVCFVGPVRLFTWLFGFSVLTVWCMFRGVCAPCIYPHARWESPLTIRVDVVVSLVVRVTSVERC